MSILSHIVEASSDTTKPRTIVVRAYDQDGRESMYSFQANPGVDVTALVTAKNTELNEVLAQGEFSQVVAL